MSADRTPAEEGEIAAMLEAQRPVPDPNFRGDLRRRLESQTADLSRSVSRPVLIRRIYGLAGSGATLLIVAAAGVAGLGPLAA